MDNSHADADRLNDTIEDSAQATGAPGLLVIGTRSFILAAPTPDAEMLIHDKYREIARRKMRTPLQQILDDVKLLPPAFAEVAIREAVGLQAGASGGIAEPILQQQIEAAMTPEGLAFRVWVFARAFDPDVKLEDVQALITPANVAAVHIDLSIVTFGKKKDAGGSEAGPNTSPLSGPSRGPAFTES